MRAGRTRPNAAARGRRLAWNKDHISAGAEWPIKQKADFYGARKLRILARQRVTKPIVDTQFQFIDLLLNADLGRSEVGIGKCHIVSAKIHVIPLAENGPAIDNSPLRADANRPAPLVGRSIEIERGTGGRTSLRGR